ncbi:MAG: PorT family protein [Bacteroidales bacterium]|nr:PorT family protein [Bacteroidales bacterium]
MKKILVIALMLSFSYGLFAQVGAYAGFNFAYNSTWLMNQQVFDDGAGQDIDPSFNYYYGFMAGYKITNNIALELNFNLNQIEQKYTGSINYYLTDRYNDYKSKTVLNTIDIPLLAKFGERSYFEIGPVLQIINKANYNIDFENNHNLLSSYWYKDIELLPSSLYENEKNHNVIEDFNKIAFAVAMGFGSDVSLIEDVLALNIGVRFQYTVSDLGGINGLGFNKDSNYVPENLNNRKEKERFSTHPLFGGFKVGLKYCF